MKSGNPMRRPWLALLAIVGAALLMTGLLTVNTWLKYQRAAVLAGGMRVSEWHKKMTDLCGQMEGLSPEAVIERFKAQGITAQIGYRDVRIKVCGITRDCVKHVLAFGVEKGRQFRTVSSHIEVSFDPIGEAFVAVVETGSFGDQKRSIVEFCDGSIPSVRDVEPR